MNSLMLAFTILILIFIPFEIIVCDEMNLESFSLSGVKNKSITHKRSRKKGRKPSYSLKSHKAGVKGHAIINGEYVETNRILMQRPTTLGVAYYPYGKPQVPVFIRAERETNKKYIVFQDPYLPPGEGYLVVLKRVPLHSNIVGDQNRVMAQGAMPVVPVPQEIPYEAYHLYLGNNIHGTFDRLNMRKFAYGIRTKFAGRKRARKKWLLRRRVKSHARRRFGMARWRGKRSTTTGGFINDFTISRINENFNNPCYLSTRLNVTQVRLKIKMKNMAPTMNSTLL